MLFEFDVLVLLGVDDFFVVFDDVGPFFYLLLVQTAFAFAEGLDGFVAVLKIVDSE